MTKVAGVGVRGDTISTSGSNARAASIVGGNGAIDKSGCLSTSGDSPTVCLQGDNDTLVNTRTITATGTDSGGRRLSAGRWLSEPITRSTPPWGGL